MKKTLYFIALCLISFSNCSAQVDYTLADKDICQSKFTLAVDKQLSKKPLGDVIAEVGKSFIGLDYEAFTLEKPGDERLIIHLTGLDCTTFLENAVTFARCIKAGKTSFEDYQRELTFVRYRDGKIDGYPSRLHYFSDWIYNNTAKGIVADMTKEIGGKPFPINVGFMSRNRDKYAQIKTNDAFLAAIRAQEEEINKREYYYIPKEKVAEIESKIENGYLIAITSGVEGLDIAHVGIAVKLDDGRIHFMHAPIVGAKVQITEKPIGDYLMKNKKQTGIMVLKPLDVQGSL